MARELSSRELQVVGGIVAGMTQKEIGKELGISHRTVNAHIVRIREALGLDGRSASIVRWYLENRHCATCTCGKTFPTPEGTPVRY
jgi:DNA-binding NarL/FixJ family response regulator